jgi:hypothetical protein
MTSELVGGAELTNALAYARRGWPVFPCRPGRKEPDTPHGFQDATTDPGCISPQLRDAVAAVYDAWWTSAHPNGTAPNAPRPPPPGAGPSAGTGAPTPPWTTTNSTSPDTGPPAADVPPAGR